MSNGSFQKEKYPIVASSTWRIELFNAFGTYRRAVIAPRHKIRTQDTDRGELFGVLLRLTALRYICSRHDVNEGSASIRFDEASYLSISQEHNIYHPIDKYNSGLQKIIMSIRGLLS